MTRTELAYCAGVIDSDGTIGIKRNTYAMRVVGDCKSPTYSERICVKQVEPEAIDLLHALFGGYRTIDDPSCKRGKRLHLWQVTDLQAAYALKNLLPFLRIKRKQAANCLALRILKEQSKVSRVAIGRGHVGASARAPALTAAMEICKARAGELNRVGSR